MPLVKSSIESSLMSNPHPALVSKQLETHSTFRLQGLPTISTCLCCQLQPQQLRVDSCTALWQFIQLPLTAAAKPRSKSEQQGEIRANKFSPELMDDWESA